MPEPDLRAEFDALTRLNGVALVPGREALMFEAFVKQHELFSELHKPWAYADEPATVAPPAAGYGG